MDINLISLVLLTLLSGCIAGILAGLLGVGGGIVVVPLLYYVLNYLNYDQSIIMHVAVGSSLLIIVPTSIRSAIQHKHRGSFDQNVFTKWTIPLLVGAIVGAVLAGYATFEVLTGIFASIAALVSIEMFLNRQAKRSKAVPSKTLFQIAPIFIGLVSVMMGIGGGSLSVPVMNYSGIEMRKAVGTSAAFGTLIAIPGSIGFIIGGLGQPLLPPFSFGYVNLIAFGLIVPATLLTVPIGVSFAHRVSHNKLRKLFALFLGITAIKMFTDVI